MRENMGQSEYKWKNKYGKKRGNGEQDENIKSGQRDMGKDEYRNDE